MIALAESRLGNLHLGRRVEDHNFDTQPLVKGHMPLGTCQDPVAYVRGNCLNILSSPRVLP